MYFLLNALFSRDAILYFQKQVNFGIGHNFFHIGIPTYVRRYNEIT